MFTPSYLYKACIGFKVLFYDIEQRVYILLIRFYTGQADVRCFLFVSRYNGKVLFRTTGSVKTEDTRSKLACYRDKHIDNMISKYR